MSKKFFTGENQDLAELSSELQFWFKSNSFEVQTAENQGVHLVQARKTSGLRTFLGTNQAFNIKLEGTPNAYSVEIGTGEWMKNLAGAGLTGLFLTGGITWVTAGVGAAWTKKLESDLWAWVEERSGKRRAAAVTATPATAAATPAAPTPATADAPSIPEQIKKLAELRDMGILSPDEFEAKKKELLSRM